MSATPGFPDWLAITTLKARYCRLLDTKDWEGLAGLMLADVVIDTTGSGGPRYEGRDDAIASIRASIGPARTAHQVHTPEIGIDGDEARAVWPMQDRLLWPDGRTLTGYGHYHERYVRDGADWKIAESRLTRLIVELTPPAA